MWTMSSIDNIPLEWQKYDIPKKMEIKFKLEEGVELPTYGSELAAAFDVTAYDIIKLFKGDIEITGEKFDKMKEGFMERGYIKLRPFERILFHTGLTVADLPKDIKLTPKDRSGVSLKRGLKVFNSPGTIDADYRGVVGIIIYNSTPFLAKINRFERIAQIEPERVIRLPLISTSESTETDRGEGGFGSSGTH